MRSELFPVVLGCPEEPINIDIQVGPEWNRLHSELLSQRREDPLYGGEGGVRRARSLRHQLLAQAGTVGKLRLGEPGPASLGAQDGADHLGEDFLHASERHLPTPSAPWGVFRLWITR